MIISNIVYFDKIICCNVSEPYSMKKNMNAQFYLFFEKTYSIRLSMDKTIFLISFLFWLSLIRFFSPKAFQRILNIQFTCKKNVDIYINKIDMSSSIHKMNAINIAINILTIYTSQLQIPGQTSRSTSFFFLIGSFVQNNPLPPKLISYLVVRALTTRSRKCGFLR